MNLVEELVSVGIQEDTGHETVHVVEADARDLLTAEQDDEVALVHPERIDH